MVSAAEWRLPRDGGSVRNASKAGKHRCVPGRYDRACKIVCGWEPTWVILLQFSVQDKSSSFSAGKSSWDVAGTMEKVANVAPCRNATSEKR